MTGRVINTLRYPSPHKFPQRGRPQCGCSFIALNNIRRDVSLAEIHLLKEKKKQLNLLFIERKFDRVRETSDFS